MPKPRFLVSVTSSDWHFSIADIGTMEDEIGDDSTVIVNVNDLVSRAEVDLGLEQLLMEDFSDQRLMRPGNNLWLLTSILKRGETILVFLQKSTGLLLQDYQNIGTPKSSPTSKSFAG